jgi:acetylornithine deacetylase
MPSLDILDTLIGFPTVSRDPNRDLIEFVRSYLAARGVEAELILAEGGRKANLLALIGPAGRPAIMLSGHTDVVPVDGQAWSTDPFRMTVRDGKAYGRGAADMKGFLASCLHLADRASRERLTTPLLLCFSHDEEVGCVGVRSAIDALDAAGRPIRLAIVGEPTTMRIATGHKGKLAARATCWGVEGHSALAPRALNAIHLACDFVGRLRRRQVELAETGSSDPDYDVPYTTLHAGLIEGGTALNIVPNRCSVDFEIRNVAADDPRLILEQLFDDAAKLAGAERARFPDARIAFDVLNEYPGLATAKADDAVAFVQGLVDEPETFKVAFWDGGRPVCRQARRSDDRVRSGFDGPGPQAGRVCGPRPARRLRPHDGPSARPSHRLTSSRGGRFGKSYPMRQKRFLCGKGRLWHAFGGSSRAERVSAG